MKVYVLTIGKDLYYAASNYEDAEYEKRQTEEENWQGRKQNIKIHEVFINEAEPDKSIEITNGTVVTVSDILALL